jgi:OOP family OmpA-OmpF porin
MKKIHFVLAVMLLIALSTPALAQIQPGAYSLSPFVGGFWFEGNQDLKPMPVYGLRLGKDFTKNWGAELVFDYVNTKYRSSYSRTNVYNYRIEALYHFMPDSKLVPFLAAGVGGMSIDSKGDEADKTRFTPAYGAGLKYFITDWLALRADVRHVLGLGSVYNNLEYGLGLTFYFGGAKPAAAPVVAAKPAEEPRKPEAAAPAVVAAPPVVDSDNDGVPDSRDKCPGTPAGVAVDKDGCPFDSDKDGVPDYLDKCPGTPAGVAVDNDGCPPDSDKDGVPDYLDKCPGTPAGVAVDNDGCPPDSDKDGVPDYLDKCPGTPAGVAVDKDGCPLDSDKDGVPDYLDKCPGTPAGVAVDKDGCPIPIPPEKVSMTLAIQFDSGKADIKSKYHEEIGKVADFLKKYPKATGTIEGHTDNVGKAAMNQKLSLQRAESVRNYIVQKFGIDPARLSAKGYGMTRPIADNKTAEGRKKNRRIEANFDVMVVKK